MNIRGRISRLAPVLTARQRAMLVLHAHIDGEEPDQTVVGSIPQEQRREYDYYIGLAYAANSHLHFICDAVARQVSSLTREHERLDMVRKAAEELEEAEGVASSLKQARRKWERDKPVTGGEFMRVLEDDLRTSQVEDALLYWQELRALELVWDEISAEVDGEDLRLPMVRNKAEKLRQELLTLLDELSPGPNRSLPEPSDQTLRDLHAHLDEAMRLYGFREG